MVSIIIEEYTPTALTLLKHSGQMRGYGCGEK